MIWTWVIWSQKGHFSLPLRLLNNPYSTEAPSPHPRLVQTPLGLSASNLYRIVTPIFLVKKCFLVRKKCQVCFGKCQEIRDFCPSTWPFWVWEAPRGFQGGPFAQGYNWTCCSWMAKVWLLGYDQVHALRQQMLLQPKYKICLWHFCYSKRKCTTGGHWRTLRGHMRILFVKR